MKKIFYLNGFKMNWLLRKGLYRMLWYALLIKIGKNKATVLKHQNGFTSIGKDRVKHLTLYKQFLVGWVIWEPIFFYKKPKTKYRNQH